MAVTIKYLSLIISLFCVHNVDGGCSFEMSTQQACDSIAGIVKTHDLAAYGKIYEMLQAVFERLDPESAPGEGGSESPKTCAEVSDEKLWDTLKIRQELNRDALQDLRSKCDNLRERYEEMRRRNSKQLSKLEKSERQYERSLLLKTQLQDSVTQLSATLMDLQSRSDSMEKALEEKKLAFGELQDQFKACNDEAEETGVMLSQLLGPSPEESYRVAGIISDKKRPFNLTAMVTNFIKRLDEKQRSVDALVSQVDSLQTENVNLQATIVDQQQELAKKENCLDEIWKDVVDENHNDSFVGACVNEVVSDFCSFEATDLAHNETCWFERTLPSDYYWRVISNERAFRGRRTSVMDHTCSSISGRFMHVDMARLLPGEEARLTTHVLRSNSRQCFSFWYNIGYNYNYGKFYVIVLMRSSSLQVWRQNLVRQGEWQHTSFEVPAHVARNGYRIRLVAEGNGIGQVSIDDLALTSGSCPR